MKLLEPLLGEWSVESTFPIPDKGHMTVEPALNGRYLLQRTTIPVPEAPNSVCMISYDADADAFIQHYFDSRGVTRTYEMEFGGGAWSLFRRKPDFSPLDLHQKWTSTISEGGDRIEGTWWASDDGEAWTKDFDLLYARTAASGPTAQGNRSEPGRIGYR